MNTLSWWIYLADVLGGVELLFGFIAVTSLGAAVFLLIIGLEHFSDMYSLSEIKLPQIKRGFRLCVIIFFLSALTVVAIPTKKTVYLIIGSEMTGDISVTPEFEKARKILNNKLDELLKQETEK